MRPVGAELFHVGGRTDGLEEASSCFSEFCERAKKLAPLNPSSRSAYFYIHNCIKF